MTFAMFLRHQQNIKMTSHHTDSFQCAMHDIYWNLFVLPTSSMSIWSMLTVLWGSLFTWTVVTSSIVGVVLLARALLCHSLMFLSSSLLFSVFLLSSKANKQNNFFP